MSNEKHACGPDCKHGSSKAIWFVVIALVVVAGGYVLSRVGKQNDGSENVKSTAQRQASNNAGGAVLAGSYESYDAAKLAKAKDGNVVLFFHANWCPTCKALDRDLEAQANNIPANLTVLQIDYDTATELKQKYGITSQSTFIQVDEIGRELKRWQGSTTLSDLVAQLI